MNRPSRILAAAAALGCAVLVALPARADRVAWSVSIGGPGYALSAGSPWVGPGIAPSPWIGPRFAPSPWIGSRFATAPVVYGPPAARRGPPLRAVVVRPLPRPVHVHPQRVIVPAQVYFTPVPRW